MRIGVDIMGGDDFPSAPIKGAIRALQSLGDEAKLTLIGDEAVIREELIRQEASAEAFEIVHTSEYIDMSESPARAVASKRNATDRKSVV